MDDQAAPAPAPAMASRPAVITLIGIVIYIWAALAAVEAIAFFLNRDDANWQARYGTSDEILTAAIVQAIVAVLLFAVASSLMSGQKWSRLLIAIVVGIRLVSTLEHPDQPGHRPVRALGAVRPRRLATVLRRPPLRVSAQRQPTPSPRAGRESLVWGAQPLLRRRRCSWLVRKEKP